MPRNRLLYLGVVLLIATVLLWAGAELARQMEGWWPYLAGLAVLLIIVGFFLEWRRSGRLRPPGQGGTDEPPAP